MKQSITREQIDELTKSGKSKLEDLFNTDPVTNKITPKKYQWNVYPSEVNIGWMIEFLADRGKNFSMGYNRNPDLWTFMKGKWWPPYKPEEMLVPELCDALWEAVKEVLNKENE